MAQREGSLEDLVMISSKLTEKPAISTESLDTGFRYI